MTPLGLPHALQIAWVGTLGLFVGSFLNVCIYRLPREGQSVVKPRRSHCPACGHQITWRENLPILSWLIQRGRCTACAGRIAWRYPFVELLTGLLFGLACWLTPLTSWPLLAIHLLVLSGLVVATFVDFDFFEIPDEVSIGGIVVAPLLAFLVPELHADTWLAQRVSDGAGVDRFGSLVGALAGMGVGGGTLWAIGWLGSKAYGREAMGFGDVKLMTAAGGFLGPGGVGVALILGSLVASVAGLGNIARFACLLGRRDRGRGRRRGLGARLRTARILGRYLPFGPYLALGIGIVLLAWEDVVRLWP